MFRIRFTGNGLPCLQRLLECELRQRARGSLFSKMFCRFSNFIFPLCVLFVFTLQVLHSFMCEGNPARQKLLASNFHASLFSLTESRKGNTYYWQTLLERGVTHFKA